MRVRSLLLMVVALFCCAALVAQQPKMNVAKADRPAEASAKTPAKPDATKPPAKAGAAKPPEVKPVVKEVDGDQAYKANCSRCHAAPRKFSERKMATIMMHMRVRANMTEEETQAILRYLTK
jgi:cytochrome c5